MIAARRNEDVIRQNLISRVRGMFPNAPDWINKHVAGGEQALTFHRERGATTGFVDNLVGLTAIEYESDLQDAKRLLNGKKQVKEYCAGLLNRGALQDRVRGVLSDTVRWRAYRISAVRGSSRKLGHADIELEVIECADCSEADEQAIARFATFLERHLGRTNSRPLDAASIASDLGFASEFCARHVQALTRVTETAENGNQPYAAMIRQLWQRFVAPVSQAAGVPFDEAEYVRELYLLTLAKLVCANALSRQSRLDSPDGVKDILSGDHFSRLGLTNLVEYDYFGWITSDQALVGEMVPVAQAIQRDLQAYDFNDLPAEDLFGRLMTQLASASQRLLLGQEWTPPWLARKLVSANMGTLGGMAPRAVDPCCGSGSIVVEFLKAAKATHPRTQGESSSHWAGRLASFVTGFDIDPLAVLLAKVSWLLAVRDDVASLDGVAITIPIYHADSLFAMTPLGPGPGADASDVKLHLDGREVVLPACLFTSSWRTVFDRLIDLASHMSRTEGGITEAMADVLVTGLVEDAGVISTDAERVVVAGFLKRLAETLSDLHAQGRNGIWSFLIRNSYRPGLLAGEFNALVSNPPWLTLSKLRSNPYSAPLRRLGSRYNLLAIGPARLHLELASVFLVHAAGRYLVEGARVACVLPKTILDGEHQRPFRERRYTAPGSNVGFQVTELWELPKGVFKNRSAVVLGTMGGEAPHWPLPGRIVGLGDLETDELTQYFSSVLGSRHVWTRHPGPVLLDTYEPANFRQGADIMPRKLFFHNVEEDTNGGLVQLSPIQEDSAEWFLVADVKRDRDFRLPQPCRMPKQLIARVFTSKMLVPFVISEPAHALLPAKRSLEGKWTRLTAADVLAMPGHMPAKEAALRAMALRITDGALALVPTLQAALDVLWSQMETRRGKMSVQEILSADKFMVFFGAGGGLVCAASISLAEREAMLPKLVVDQTLYWTIVSTADEADYLVAALNSPTVSRLIKPFQPEGVGGDRHIHELPVQLIPPYDPTSAEAVSLRDAGRALQEQLRHTIAENGPGIRAMLDPNTDLAHRRRAIRLLLRHEAGWANYVEAAERAIGGNA